MPSGTVILLNFLKMDIPKCIHWRCEPCDYDYFEIRDGPSADSHILDKLCGSDIPAVITSSQNQLWMKWVNILIKSLCNQLQHVLKLISDSSLMMMPTSRLDFILSTVPWCSSRHVVEVIQMKVESCPHPHTQMPIQKWQTVSTSYLSPLELMSTSPFSPWTLIARD